LTRPAFDKAAGQPQALQDAVMWVIKKGALRTERMNEILTQITVPYAFFAMLLNLQPGRHSHVYELMAAALQLSGLVVMQFKHHFRVRRPADRSPLVQPVILTPGHGSFPAGHATQCHLLATILTRLVGNRLGGDSTNPGGDVPAQLKMLADRIGENRVVAGVHYKEDIEQGAVLGNELAAYFLAKAIPAASTPPGTPLQWLWNKANTEQWN
jgi:membrane-associated phospholipid phosphatase